MSFGRTRFTVIIIYFAITRLIKLQTFRFSVLFLDKVSSFDRRLNENAFLYLYGISPEKMNFKCHNPIDLNSFVFM